MLHGPRDALFVQRRQIMYRQLHQQVRIKLGLEPKVSLRTCPFKPWHRHIKNSFQIPEHHAIHAHDSTYTRNVTMSTPIKNKKKTFIKIAPQHFASKNAIFCAPNGSLKSQYSSLCSSLALLCSLGSVCFRSCRQLGANLGPTWCQKLHPHSSSRRRRNRN